mmetsp:Transcript_27831/g.69854  ORF Transcript_27831/g.69854 Transcript_27831/m.69854 type:complete len:419 (-) Transcript_27831:3074-4330(-)
MRMEPGLSRDSAPRTSGSTASAPRSFTSQNDSTVVRTPSASRTRTWSICLTRPGTSTGMATNTSPSRENAALAICSTVSAGMRSAATHSAVRRSRSCCSPSRTSRWTVRPSGAETGTDRSSRRALRARRVSDTLADSPGTTPSGISCRSAKICTISLTLSPSRTARTSLTPAGTMTGTATRRRGLGRTARRNASVKMPKALSSRLCSAMKVRTTASSTSPSRTHTVALRLAAGRSGVSGTTTSTSTDDRLRGVAYSWRRCTPRARRASARAPRATLSRSFSSTWYSSWSRVDARSASHRTADLSSRFSRSRSATADWTRPPGTRMLRGMRRRRVVLSLSATVAAPSAAVAADASLASNSSPSLTLAPVVNDAEAAVASLSHSASRLSRSSSSSPSSSSSVARSGSSSKRSRSSLSVVG